MTAEGAAGNDKAVGLATFDLRWRWGLSIYHDRFTCVCVCVYDCIVLFYLQMYYLYIYQINEFWFDSDYMGPTWVLQAPYGPHIGPMNLAIGESTHNVAAILITPFVVLNCILHRLMQAVWCMALNLPLAKYPGKKLRQRVYFGIIRFINSSRVVVVRGHVQKYLHSISSVDAAIKKTHGLQGSSQLA